MNKWISVNEKLPPLHKPVLCIIKANCACDHWLQGVLSREKIADDGEWIWHTGFFTENDPEGIATEKEKVKYWQNLLKMPPSFIPGWTE
jgi:hypothetical protein